MIIVKGMFPHIPSYRVIYAHPTSLHLLSRFSFLSLFSCLPDSFENTTNKRKGPLIIIAIVSIRDGQFLAACHLVFEFSQLASEDRHSRDAVCLVALTAKVRIEVRLQSNH